MSESDKIRLDPPTLRWVAGELGKPWGEDPVDEQERGAKRALGIMSDFLVGWAAEAEARQPLLSDWVRACESTKLGSFTLGQTKNGLAFFFGEDGHEWIVDFHPDLTMAFIEKVDDCAAYTCATPVELTAVLDRLAEEAARGE